MGVSLPANGALRHWKGAQSGGVGLDGLVIIGERIGRFSGRSAPHSPIRGAGPTCIFQPEQILDYGEEVRHAVFELRV